MEHVRLPQSEHGIWGREGGARRLLWETAARHGEWILINDADQILVGDVRGLCQSSKVNAWAFVLFDMWSANEYREDQFWRGHLHARPWLFNPSRVPDGYFPVWSERGIHVGHQPQDFPLQCGIAPADKFHWVHFAYSTQQDRARKLESYRKNFHQMTAFEQAHAESIADPNPNLRILPFAKPIKILVGAPVRKNATVLKAHLDSLIAQELPPRVKLDFCFVDDYPQPDPAQQVLADFVAAHGGRVLKSGFSGPVDFTDQHPVTHQWTATAMNRVGAIKNGLLKECLTGQYDFLWLVDSDLILDKTTLASMLAAQKHVVAAVYWTRWNTDPKICAGPQVWLKPVYQLGLPHYPESEFRRVLGVERKLERVGGLGACTLIARQVIEKGINFSKPPDFPSGGLWDGEDRHFCEWARRMHVELWADAWPDIMHLYHPQQVEMIPEWSARLGESHPTYANMGHLVSLRLTNVEDGIGPVSVRCRLGDGTLLPELEQHIQAMKRGEDKMVRVHFPNTTPAYANLNLQNQNRLIQVELLDLKPFALPPILADEFYEAQGIGSVQDKTHLAQEQHDLIAAGQS